jgi:lysozyme family protein
MAAVSFTSSLSDEYRRLFDTCQIRPERASEVNATVKKIAQHRDRYQLVGGPLRVPWYFVGVIHCMEGSLSFSRHLHNGDPLTARTVQEPPNRPVSGQPPFTWEASATDALAMKKLQNVTDWSLPRTLYQLEGYNGFGYRLRHPEVLTPYLWSFSGHYTQGKYIADGTFSPTAGSKQCGAAILLRRMAELGILQFERDGAPVLSVPDSGRPSRTPPVTAAPLIRFSTTRKSPEVEDLQRMLNTFPGIFVKVDGVPGERTSTAVKKVTGEFLLGDPRRGEG